MAHLYSDAANLRAGTFPSGLYTFAIGSFPPTEDRGPSAPASSGEINAPTGGKDVAELPNRIRCYPGEGVVPHECEVAPLSGGLEVTFFGPRDGVKSYSFEPPDAQRLLEVIGEVLRSPGSAKGSA